MVYVEMGVEHVVNVSRVHAGLIPEPFQKRNILLMKKRIERALLVIAGAGINEHKVAGSADHPSMDTLYQVISVVLEVSRGEACRNTFEIFLFCCRINKAFWNILKRLLHDFLDRHFTDTVDLMREMRECHVTSNSN
ncbi:hypothetical protein O206_19880 [Ochrobactrum sp. EGD-AQ16]|nr:hypothetical protein O206_19880 [Ochrobactrum sp. EGD-AQ16]